MSQSGILRLPIRLSRTFRCRLMRSFRRSFPDAQCSQEEIHDMMKAITNREKTKWIIHLLFLQRNMIKKIKQTLPYYEEFYAQTIELVKTACGQKVSWLDVGCGTAALKLLRCFGFLICRQVCGEGNKHPIRCLNNVSLLATTYSAILSCKKT